MILVHYAMALLAKPLVPNTYLGLLVKYSVLSDILACVFIWAGRCLFARSVLLCLPWLCLQPMHAI